MIFAFPFTRNVSFMPGTRKSSPTPLLSITFKRVSVRLLPSLSGKYMVFSSLTLTKPGASPLGDTSPRPSLPIVPMTKNGEISMNARQCLSRWSNCLSTARSDGSPYNCPKLFLSAIPFILLILCEYFPLVKYVLPDFITLWLYCDLTSRFEVNS